jgi:type IV fimbrial biogenesis protein FimT
MNLRSSRVHRGFTLIEALVVMTLVGVLLAIAAPSFVTFTATQKVKTASFDLYAALLFARSEAIKRRQNVTVAPNGGDWKAGWTITTVIGGVATTLRSQDSLSGVVFSGDTSVVYRLDGRLTNPATSVSPPCTTALCVLIQPQSADTTIPNRCIRIDPTGLPKSSTTSATTCV